MAARTIEERLDGQKRAIITLRQEVGALKATVADLQDVVDALTKALNAAPVEQGPTSTVLAPAVPVSGNSLRNRVELPIDKGNQTIWAGAHHCMACGTEKEPGREKYLTCRNCASIRDQQIKKTYIGEPVRYTMCGHCGKPKGASFDPVCGKCSVTFRKWRDA